MKKILLLSLTVLGSLTMTGCTNTIDSIGGGVTYEEFIKKVEERADTLKYNVGWEHDRINIHDESKRYDFNSSSHTWTYGSSVKYLEAKYFAMHLKEEAEKEGKSVDDEYGFYLYKKDHEKYMCYISTKDYTEDNGSLYEFDKSFGLLLFAVTRVGGEPTESYSYLYERK